MDGSAAPIGDVIMLSAEDDAADTIRPRLDAAGADVNRVFVLEAVTTETRVGTAERGFSLREDIDKLDQLLSSMPACQLVTVDPISAYLDGIDSHNILLHAIDYDLSKV